MHPLAEGRIAWFIPQGHTGKFADVLSGQSVLVEESEPTEEEIERARRQDEEDARLAAQGYPGLLQRRKRTLYALPASELQADEPIIVWDR